MVMFEAYNDTAPKETINMNAQSKVDKLIIKGGDINPSYMSINIKVNNNGPPAQISNNKHPPRNRSNSVQKYLNMDNKVKLFSRD